jgi:hypothetical protein
MAGVIAVVIILIAGAVFVSTSALKKTRTSLSQNGTANSASPKNVNEVYTLANAEFAPYKEEKSTVKPSLGEYSLKSTDLVNLKDVQNEAKTQFGPDQLQALEKTGFFTQPTIGKPGDPEQHLDISGNRADDMVDLYYQFSGSYRDFERKPENAIFVSTDFLLHTFHVLVDRSYQKAEQEYFAPTLTRLTEALYQDALNKYSQEKDSTLKESWKRLTAFYLVPRTILKTATVKKTDYFSEPAEEDAFTQQDKNSDSAENVQKQIQQDGASIPQEIATLAQQELNLVMKADATVTSPLYGKLKPESREDYTQYGPRSHYTKNSVLRTYFRAMMWYGRHGFEVTNTDLTRDAALMTWQLKSVDVNNMKAAKLWEKIYVPTVFFVGKSDDLSLYEYSDLLTKIYGDSPSDSAFADASKLDKFQNEAKQLEGPKILSEIKVFKDGNVPTKDELLKNTKGFRFMGQRFIPDSYMLASLTQGDEPPDKETGQKLPSTPTALMVMSVLGSNTADSLLNDWVKENAPDSDKVIAKVKNQLQKEFQSYDEKTWTQNMYWSWLYNLKPLFEQHNEGYPMFMRNDEWSKKSLLAALGSWTELRHDTLLYAKQSYSEMGGGGGEPPPPPPVPKGYVEPNMSFLTRLIALTTMTRDGMKSQGIMHPNQEQKFEDFLKSLNFFKDIAEKELSDSIISDDDYEKLRLIIKSNYPNIVWTPDGNEMTEQDARAAIIADVHTDAKKGQILYEATGVPTIIYVAVKDKGGTRLTRGVTYSYYEFTRPLGTRLTDLDWQGMIYDKKNSSDLPSTPSWTKDLTK